MADTTAAMRSYMDALQVALLRGDATEHTHRPALKTLVEAVSAGIVATNEPRRSDCGAPDFSIAREGLTIGHIECKDVGVDLPAAERSDQLRRYRASLPNLILTDYVDFRWLVAGELKATACLGRWDGKRLSRDRDGWSDLAALLGDFLAQDPVAISTPRELAERLARLTHLIREVVMQAFVLGVASDDLAGLRQAFADTLIPDLASEKKVGEFADMYAQTLAYGLFAARCFHRGTGASFRRLGAAAGIPQTNPFLRRLFESITGTALADEPHAGLVDDLVQVLAHSDIDAVLREFGQRTRREDPVVHFYETFLSAYDPELREKRGVYYTPEPVVSFIVRSVDWLLKEKFALAGGLADPATVEVERAEPDDSGKPRSVRETHPKVLILDPACGTGTFLYGVIDHIREAFRDDDNAGMWPGFVRQHLLPRLFGFELLMAPYAVAHLKLGLELAGRDLPEEERERWAYEFAPRERLNILLTNTLEAAPEHVAVGLPQFGVLGAIADEARAAVRVKRDLPIMVVMGNPPYSNFGRQNRNPWILGLLDDYKLGLAEKKLNLDNDFIKFIRWAQWRIEQSGQGILAFITSHVYLDGLTHRRMRRSLLETFDDIYILDLHGNSRKPELPPGGGVDENVFDIQEGVAVAIMVRSGAGNDLATVRHAELWGLREQKHAELLASDVTNTAWTKLTDIERKTCLCQQFFFRPAAWTHIDEYCAAPGLIAVLPIGGPGTKCERDNIARHFSRDELLATVRDFRTLEPHVLRQQYALGSDSRDWSIAGAQADVRQHTDDERLVRQFLYRPFDIRCIWYSGKTRGFVGTPSRPTMTHLCNNGGLAIITTRQTHDQWGAFVTRYISNHKLVSSYDINTVFPLYLYPDGDARQPQLYSDSPWPPGPDARVPNLDPGFVAEAERRLRLSFVSDGRGDLETSFGPEDLLAWIYAIFWAPSYRQRYADFLKIDFPRVPMTNDLGLFRELLGLGHELVGLHLLKSDRLAHPITRFPIAGDNLVERGFPKYVPKTQQVRINAVQYFDCVPSDVWECVVGGYQPCERWLRDRRGRRLTYDDLTHYQRVVTALAETLRLAAEIDRAIGKLGGWPLPGSGPAGAT